MKGFLKYHIKDRLALESQRRKLRNNHRLEPILVFTMAKVGSLSVYSSLKKQCRNPIFHIHSLNEAETANHVKLCLDKGIYPGSRSPVFLINEEVIRPLKPTLVISVFRNPIERNISAFFDAFELHTGVSVTHYDQGLENLITIFHKKLNHAYAMSWFEKQFFEGLGVNVYDYNFDSSKGYGFINKENISILVMNSELIDSDKRRIIGDFCGIDHFQLHNVNVTSQSKKAALYRSFKDHIRFSKKYLEQQLESRYVRHFFSETDKQKLYERWSE